MAESIYIRTLRRAVDISGGAGRLARDFGVPAHQIERWLDGVGEPPIEIFLRAVDVVVNRKLRDVGRDSDSQRSADSVRPEKE